MRALPPAGIAMVLLLPSCVQTSRGGNVGATEPTTSLVVHVVDQQNAALPGALVWMCPTAGGEVLSARTSQAGDARFDSLAADKYLIRAGGIVGFRMVTPPVLAERGVVAVTVQLEMWFHPGDVVESEGGTSATPTPLPCSAAA
jgi:hypothetical protein